MSTTTPVLVALLVAFVCYANGAALLAHHALEHGPGAQAASGHAGCGGGHGHTDTTPTPQTPEPGTDEQCPLCDMFVATETQAIVTPGPSPTPPAESHVDQPHTGRLCVAGQPTPSLSRRGPPSSA